MIRWTIATSNGNSNNIEKIWLYLVVEERNSTVFVRVCIPYIAVAVWSTGSRCGHYRGRRSDPDDDGKATTTINIERRNIIPSLQQQQQNYLMKLIKIRGRLWWWRATTSHWYLLRREIVYPPPVSSSFAKDDERNRRKYKERGLRIFILIAYSTIIKVKGVINNVHATIFYFYFQKVIWYRLASPYTIYSRSIDRFDWCCVWVCRYIYLFLLLFVVASSSIQDASTSCSSMINDVL